MKLRIGSGALLVMALATPFALDVAPAQAQEQHRVSGTEVAIYNLAGEVEVVRGGGSDVVVEVTRGGSDASQLDVAISEINGRQTLRVIYPADEIVYGELGRGSKSTVRGRDDGTFFGNTFVSFADLLGDTRFIFALSTVSTFSNLDFFYIDMSRRINLTYHAYQHEDFYFTSNLRPMDPNNPNLGFINEVVRIEQRFTGGSFNIQYPWNRYYGFEAGIGLSDNKVPTFTAEVVNFGGENITIKTIQDNKYQALDASFFFTGDTVRWQTWGPLAGQRFRIGAIYSPELGGSEATVSQYFLDYRKYWKITRNSSFAWRTFGIFSNSRSTEFQRIYSIGGLNQLRGASFRSYVGDRVFFQNLEFRFPLVRDLIFPFGGGFRNIMGVLFMDIGGAYFSGGGYWDPDLNVLVGKAIPGGDFRDCYTQTGYIDELQNCREPYDFWNSEGGFLQNGFASWGIGFNFRISIMELNWVFAQRIGLEGDNGPWHSAFYIGNKF